MANFENITYSLKANFKLSKALIKYELFVKSIPICNTNNNPALYTFV